ncbi:D-glycero-beta-D-manno-heptose 1,7-bisphosphate 7-phosphatase [Methylophilaceae bacterium]|jgi:D-glycero-D-manno-heptose 1,7-bisphosphate phosphatase|nr:D-glycero-beta-D-manno-heptose 1,7-bisphosphate 7-phosphatase [Methylophilaceae bacterium]|tara:strand:+ start:5967 stop:6503 length:537 start_codon:yes stop_codon:yes gene_type:complete
MKLVILDRDGVINQDSVHYIKSPNEWIPIPNSLESIARLNQHGFSIIIATNQSGIGRGLFDIETMNAVNKKMLDLIAQVGGHIDAIFYCPHTEDVNCKCRKPRSGMLEEISTRFGTNLKNIPAIGDAPRDLIAYESVGAQPILVKTGKGEETFEKNSYPKNTWIFNDLSEAVDKILKR